MARTKGNTMATDTITLSGVFDTPEPDDSHEVVHVTDDGFESVAITFPNGEPGNFMGYDTWVVTIDDYTSITFCNSL